MSPQAEDASPFHKKQRSTTNLLLDALRSNRITTEDAELIKIYLSEYAVSKNIKNGGLVQITRVLIAMRKACTTYEGSTIEDLYSIIHEIKTGKSNRDQTFTPATQHIYLIIIKAFFSWLIENGRSNIPLKKLQNIKAPEVPVSKRTSSDLLTADEISAILKCCTNSRNRAFFTVLYEGGFRVQEVATLRWGMVKFDSYGVIVNVTMKTNKMRYLRLVMSKESLAKWKSDYPGDIESDSFVFLNNRGEMLNYQALSKILSDLVKKAGIKKKVTLHLFRHSRITHLIQQGVNESVIKMMMWGTVNSRAFAAYAHLSGMDVDREVMKLYNISEEVTDKPADKKLEPRICTNCREINGPTAKYCPTCGVPLDNESIQDRDRFIKWLFENPEIFTEYLNNRKT